MTIFDELQELLENTFSDRRMDVDEKVELFNALQSLSHEQRAFVRNRAFALVRGVCDNEPVWPLLKWLEAVIKSLDMSEAPEAESEVYFSPGATCAKALLKLIQSTKKTLDVCVFTISENGLRDALLEAYKRGIEVRIITDNDKTFDRGSDINTLTEAGLLVKTDDTSNHMHHKFVVSDNKRLATGSFNWTRSASLYNHENLVVINDVDVVTKFTREFGRIWDESIVHKV